MPAIRSMQAWPAAWSGLETKTMPSSLTSTFAPVSSWIRLMFLPPGPINSPIFVVGIWIVLIFGANWLSSVRAAGRASFILPRICIRALRASSRAWRMTSRLRPLILVSSWKAVMPCSVPVTLKSMSPR